MRHRLRARTLKTLVLLQPLAGAAVLASGCINSTATPGGGEDAALPLYDAGQPPVNDATVPVDGADASVVDSTVPVDSAPGVDAADANPGVGSIVGQVRDVNQFNQGVVPGATVSVVGGPSTTTDVNGTFTLTGVTAGPRVLVTVT